jgi:hypothetical protein
LILTERREKIMINENILGARKKHHSTQNEAYDEVNLHGGKIPTRLYIPYLGRSPVVVILCAASFGA